MVLDRQFYQPQLNTMISIFLMLIITTLTGCSTTPEIQPHLQSQQPLVNYALSLQGIPYHYGKASPEEGFDCSGFVQHVYSKHGVWLPRTVNAWPLHCRLYQITNFAQVTWSSLIRVAKPILMLGFSLMMVNLYMHLAVALDEYVCPV
jgi:NlpC/P60 family